MTRKELESVYCLKKELEMWQQKLAELQADIAMNSKGMDGMPYSNTNENHSPTEIKAIQLADADQVIKGKIKEIQWTIREIDIYITTSVNDSEMRQILEYRCAQCKTWEWIGDQLGYDRTTVAKKYSAFLDETFPQFPQV